MRDVDLNLLYTLHVFVEQGSLADAARVLGRSEPAVSARLHRLEDELGVAIFEKVGRRLVLTPAGREVHREARVIVGRVHHVLDAARSASAEPAGRLRIGTLGTVGVYMLAPIICRFVERHARVTVEMTQASSTDLVDRLLDGELDFVASIGEPPNDPRLAVEVVREIRAVVVAPPGRFARRRTVAAADLRDEPLLEWALADDLFFGHVSRFLADEQLADNVRVQVPHIATLKMLVLHGAGLAILPDYTVVDDSLVAVPLRGIRVVQPLWLAYREAAARSPALGALLALF